MTKLAVLGSYYKSEDYLKTYLKSARKQAFKDFEILRWTAADESSNPLMYEEIKCKNKKVGRQLYNDGFVRFYP